MALNHIFPMSYEVVGYLSGLINERLHFWVDKLSKEFVRPRQMFQLLHLINKYYIQANKDNGLSHKTDDLIILLLHYWWNYIVTYSDCTLIILFWKKSMKIIRGIGIAVFLAHYWIMMAVLLIVYTAQRIGRWIMRKNDEKQPLSPLRRTHEKVHADMSIFLNLSIGELIRHPSYRVQNYEF